jgi:hypothetical protein
VIALRGVFSDESQVRSDKGSLFVGYVTRVRFARFHTLNLPQPCTEFITPSREAQEMLDGKNMRGVIVYSWAG